MRASRMLSLSVVLAALAAAGVQAQFIHDLGVRDDVARPILPRPGPPRFAPIVIARHAVAVKIDDGVATTTIRQTFRNPNQVQLEGTYFFPLPEDAAIAGFSLSMGGKMVPGEVLEREKAAGIYRSIVARALDPALLEYVGRRLFQAKIFPIPALGTTDIELSYSETLTRSGSLVEYRYPLRTQGPVPAVVDSASVLVEITSKTPLRALYSPSHPVDVSRKGDLEAKVSFEQKPCPADRDFVLTIGLGNDPIGAMMLSHVEQGTEGAFALLLSPSVDSKAAEAVAKDVVFVADTSGSMAGDKIEQLRRALSFCLRSLNKGDRFGLIPFSTEPRPWSEKLTDVTPASIDQALAAVRDIKALGGTNICDSLTLALAMSQDRARPFLVIFLTDGQPTVGTTDVDSILRSVREKNQALTRLFVFGVGHDVNTTLLDSLAEQNHGAHDYVDEREDIEVKVSSFYEKVANPVVSDVRVEIDGVKTEEIYPKKLPDLFRGGQLMLTGRFRGEGDAKVRLTGQVNGRTFEATYLLKVGGSARRPELPRLWAVRKVGYLLDQIRLNGVQKELRDEVVRLGVKYGIVTPYTSFLVVEDTPQPTLRQRMETGAERSHRGVAPTGGGRDDNGAFGWGGGAQPAAPEASADPQARFNTPAKKSAAPSARRLGDSEGKLEKAEEAVDDFLTMSAGGKAPAGTTTTLPPADGKPGADARNSDALLGEETRADKAGRSSRDRDAGEAAKAARGYFSDAISLSRQLKELREAQSEGGTSTTSAMTRVGSRTFYLRRGVQVDAATLALDPTTLGARLVRIEMCSQAYFDLLTKRPDLGPVLALGSEILFVDGESLIRIVPPSPESRPESR